MTESSSSVMEVTHVIFDMDGLLLDTERLYSVAHSEFLRQYNHEFTNEVKRKQMGRSIPEAAKVLIDEYQLPCSVEYCVSSMKDIYTRVFANTDLLPGAERLVRHLAQYNIPICVATGSSKYNYTLKTARHMELFGLFSHIVLSEDPEVVNGKPEPDIFLVAARRFKHCPHDNSKVLVFEDAVNGVEAARKAGMKCVWVPNLSYGYDVAAVSSRATVTLDSLETFQPEMFGLPPFS